MQFQNQYNFWNSFENFEMQVQNQMDIIKENDLFPNSNGAIIDMREYSFSVFAFVYVYVYAFVFDTE